LVGCVILAALGGLCLVAAGCGKRTSLGGGWVIEEYSSAIPESGGYHRHLLRREGARLVTVAKNIANYKRFGEDCVAFEPISINQEIRASCGTGAVVSVVRGARPESWKMAGDGLENLRGIEPRGGVASEVGWLIPYEALGRFLRHPGSAQKPVPGRPAEVSRGVPVVALSRPLSREELERGDRDGRTLLIQACENGDAASVTALLKAGADVNRPDNIGHTPLIMASGNASIVRILLEAGANPNVESRSGWTPLEGAATDGCVECVRLLLAHGADPWHSNEFASLAEARDRNRSVVASLLEKARAEDSRPCARLAFASMRSDIEAIRHLLSGGTGVNCFASNLGPTPLMVAKGPAMTSFLLSQDAEVDLEDSHGNTALFYAVNADCLECVKALLAHGADPWHRNRAQRLSNAMSSDVDALLQKARASAPGKHLTDDDILRQNELRPTNESPTSRSR
jgi:ankyrin repeat protein